MPRPPSSNRLGPPAPHWDLVAESFDEAEFLWARWEDALDSPRHTLDDVGRWVEERLLGAIDGVRLGGPRAIAEVLAPALSARRDRRAAVATFVLSTMGDAGCLAIAEALATVEPSRLTVLGSGLRHALEGPWPDLLRRRLRELPVAAQAVVVDAMAHRRYAVGTGFDAHIDRTAAIVQRSVLRLAAVANGGWADAYVAWGLRRSDPTLCIEAARAGMLRGIPRATELALELVAGRVAGSETLLPGLALVAATRTLPVITHCVRAGESDRPLFDALACIGTIEAADLCVDALARPGQAKLAAEAWSTITGEPTPADPAATDDIDRSSRRADLLLPAPRVAQVRETWRTIRSGWTGRQRHFEGRPFTPATLPERLRTATTRRRHPLAMDLALRTRGARYVDTTAWTAIQRRQLSAGIEA